jgi:hypothetical protein
MNIFQPACDMNITDCSFRGRGLYSIMKKSAGLQVEKMIGAMGAYFHAVCGDSI